MDMMKFMYNIETIVSDVKSPTLKNFHQQGTGTSKIHYDDKTDAIFNIRGTFIKVQNIKNFTLK